MKSNTLYAELQVRGLVAQATDPRLADALEHQKLTYYVGFDPTSDSLHIGSLLPLITMRRLQLHGHKPLVVLGGATGRIGDPSGKAAERVLLDEAQVVKNLEGIRRVVHRFLEPSGPNGVEILDNFDWFKGMGAIPFLRDVGKHFTVNHDTGLMNTVHKTGIGQTMCAGCRIDTLNPQAAEVALFITTVAVSIAQGFLNTLQRNAVAVV